MFHSLLINGLPSTQYYPNQYTAVATSSMVPLPISHGNRDQMIPNRAQYPQPAGTPPPLLNETWSARRHPVPMRRQIAQHAPDPFVPHMQSW
jgi:hypothetical protein